MKTHELVSAVQASAGIDTHEHAERAVHATLEVLGQRLSTEAKDLAAQLPDDLAAHLRPSAEVERFGLEEFYQRVSDAEGCSPEEARRHARAVTAALREAVGPEYRHLTAQLPDDWGDLLHTDNVQH